MNQGFIVPFDCTEVLPSDDIRHKTQALVRTQPLLAPVYHSCEVKIHHFFVPTRLLWDDWEKFITGGRDGLDESVPPTLEVISTTGSLACHLGIPNLATAQEVSALPFRAYNMIYNEYFRDQDLQDPIANSLAGGEDTTTATDLLSACWRKDYFTTARPDTQKGDDVEISLAGSAPVTGIATDRSSFPYAVSTGYETDGDSAVTYTQSERADVQAVHIEEDPDNEGFPNIRAQLSDVSAVSINDLRLATRLQTYKENMLRYGSRYTERLQQAFGVRPQDSRMQRPELLASGKNVIQFSEIMQTAPSVDDTSDESVAALKGHGINVTSSNRYRKRFQEYGFIISVMTIRPKTMYQQGLHKMWSRTTKEMYYQPELDGIGMQIIKNRELKADHANPDGTFGFNNRYDEYRYCFDEVSGEFRNTLDFWHMARKFATDPALNDDFVTCEGVDRIFATDADQFLVRTINKRSIKRKVSAIGNPFVF